MTKDEIILMAQKAQMPFYWRTGEITYLDKLEAFAKLVEERTIELCAKVCEERGMVKGGEVFAARIRARKQEALKQLNTEETV
jgi:hypothetical protein